MGTEIVVTTEKRIRDILSRDHSVDEIVPTAPFRDAGLDSLDCTELLMSVETEFDFEIPAQDEDDLDTLQKLVAYVDRKKSN